MAAPFSFFRKPASPGSVTDFYLKKFRGLRRNFATIYDKIEKKEADEKTAPFFLPGAESTFFVPCTFLVPKV